MIFKTVLDRLRLAGAEHLPEYDVQRGICIGVNVMSICIVFLNAVSGILFYALSHHLAILIGAFAEIGLVLGVIALNGRRRYQLANVTFYSIIVLSTFYFSAILGKTSETQL